MDFGSELFWVVMVIVYLVFQVLGARKKRQQHREQRPTPQDRGPLSAPSNEETELDEALREIRRALGFPEEQQEAAPQEDTTPVPTDDAWIPPGGDRPPAPDTRLETQPAPEHPAEALPPQAKTTVSSPSARREPPKIPPRIGDSRTRRQPERSTAQAEGVIYTSDEKAKLRRGTTYAKLDEQPSETLSPRKALMPPSPTMPPPQTPRTSGLPDVAKRLRNATSARQAFLMKEILDPPRALRRRR